MRTIAIFARWPRVGHTKTRLTPGLTADLAHLLHVAMLRDALDAALGAPAGRRTLWWAGAPAERVRFLVPEPIEVFDQPAGDLGDRLAHTFAALHRTPGDRVMIIGSDCPWLEAAAIDYAFEALERSEAVVGPADDGGFHLIGLTYAAVRLLPALFQGIPWSTERTLEETLIRIRAAGLSVDLLPAASDVDTPADVIKCVRWAMCDPAGGKHTRAALVAMGLLPGSAM